MHALKTLAAAVVTSLTLGACASAGGPTSLASMSLADGPHAGRSQAVEHAVSQAAVVKVSNYNWQDVVVYAVAGAQRVRLGQVTSMNTVNFRLPTHMVTSTERVRLLVDPIGSTEGWQSEDLIVHGGDEVQFNVQNSLPMSSVLVSR
jgi:hypothetical protein